MEGKNYNKVHQVTMHCTDKWNYEKGNSPVFRTVNKEGKSILPWRLIAGRQGIVYAGSVWNRKRRGRRWKRIIVSCCLNT